MAIDRSRLEQFSRGLSAAQDLYFKGQMAVAQQARERMEATEAQKTVNAFAESLFQRRRTPEGETEVPVSNESFLRNYTKARTRLGTLGRAGQRAAEGLDVAAQQWSTLQKEQLRSATDIAEAELRANTKFPPNVTEAQLALLASQGDAQAAAALKSLQQARVDVKRTATPKVQQFITDENVFAVEVDDAGQVQNVRSLGPPKKTGATGKLTHQIPVTYQENGKLKTETIKGLNAEDAQRQILTQKLQIERQLQALTSQSVQVADDELRGMGWTNEQLQKVGAYDPDTDTWSLAVNLDMLAANDPLGEKLKQTIFKQMETQAADDAEYKKQIDAAFQGTQGAQNALNKWIALRRAQTQVAQAVSPEAGAQVAPAGETQAAPPAPTEGAPAEQKGPNYMWQIDPAQATGALKQKIDALNDPTVPPAIKQQVLDLLLKKGYLKQG